jgi:hypothetical protein
MPNVPTTNAPVNNRRVDLPQAVAENVLTMLCLNREHGKLISELVTPQDFESEVHRTIATRAIQYWHKYKRPPGKSHTADLVSDILEDKDNRRRITYKAVLNGMLALNFEGVNAQYVIDTVRTLQREVALRSTTFQAAEQLESRRHLAITDVEDLFEKVLKGKALPIDGLGLRLGSDCARFLRPDDGAGFEFQTGIPAFDRIKGLTPARGKLHIMIASSGGNKTWWLQHLSLRNALVCRRKVLHISFELDENASTHRYYQACSRAAQQKEYLRVPITRLRLQNEGKRDERLVGLEKAERRAPFSMQNRKAATLVWNYMRPMIMDRIRIRRFPPHSLTVAQLDAVIQQHISCGFSPDLLVLDYLPLLDLGNLAKGDNYRLNLKRTTEEVEALGIERNIALATAVQANRDALKVRRITRAHIAEDISAVQTADTVFCMNAMAHEQQHSLARIYVDKNRYGSEQNFEVLLAQNLKHAQFVRQSVRLPPNYENALDELINALPTR